MVAVCSLLSFNVAVRCLLNVVVRCLFDCCFVFCRCLINDVC